tara:strand:- start:13726 stop:14571 length:846 start_codon:yes stop_codon:yes gene_type:complete
MEWFDHKIQYQGKVFQLRFPNGIYFYIRHLNYGEYRTFNTLYSSPSASRFYVDELVAKTVVLNSFFTDDWLTEQKAGICTTISSIVMYLGGDHSASADHSYLNSLVEIAQQDSASLSTAMYARICNTFPAYKFSDLDNLTFPEVVRLFSAAEKLLVDMGMLESFSKITTAEEEVLRSAGSGPRPSGTTSSDVPKFVVTEKDIKQSYAQFGDQENMGDVREAMIEQEQMRKRIIESNKKANIRPNPNAVRDSVKAYNKKVSSASRRKKTATTTVKRKKKKAR